MHPEWKAIKEVLMHTWPNHSIRKNCSFAFRKLLEIRQTLQKRYQGGNIPAEPKVEDPTIQAEDAFLTKVRQSILDNLDDSNYQRRISR